MHFTAVLPSGPRSLRNKHHTKTMKLGQAKNTSACMQVETRQSRKITVTLTSPEKKDPSSKTASVPFRVSRQVYLAQDALFVFLFVDASAVDGDVDSVLLLLPLPAS